mgnify:CR=1 FL=1
MLLLHHLSFQFLDDGSISKIRCPLTHDFAELLCGLKFFETQLRYALFGQKQTRDNVINDTINIC